MKPDPAATAFDSPTIAAWVAAAERELKGRTPDDLRWHTDGGLTGKPLYTAADCEGLPHLEAGVLDAVMPDHAWAIRQRLDAAAPGLAAQLAADATASGVDQLLLRFDKLVCRGADPATLAESEVDVDLFDTDAGTGGLAVYHAESLAEVLRDVDLRHTRLALDSGSSTLAAFGMVLHIAEQRGIAAKDLQLELGHDPLRELITGPTLADAADNLLSETNTLVQATADLAGVTPLAAHSHPYHDAGAAPAEELACVILTAIEYLRRCGDTDRNPLALHFAVDTDMYVEVAKLRAARLLFANVARAFGRSDVRVPIHAESSGRSFSADDVDTNLIRTNVQAFTATLGGCDSIAIAPYDLNHDERDRDAHRLARNQLILLREESMLQRVGDPCRGAYAIEALTDQIARAAWEFVREVEDRGGMLTALDEGFVQERIAASAERRQQLFATGRRALVGTSRYVDVRFQKPDRALLDTESIQHHMFAYLARRSETDLLVAADDRDSLVAAASAGCTVGEIARAIRGNQPIELETTFYERSADGAPFEVLRDLVTAAGITAQPILVGPPKFARARAAFAREWFAMAGIEWLNPVADTDAAATHAQILVWCGEDDAVDAQIREATSSQLKVVAAPSRESIESRVDAFVHRGGDALRTMRELYFQITGDA